MDIERFPEIKPKKLSFKDSVIRTMFYFLGMGFQTAYRVDSDVKKEIDTWPETFTFVMSVREGPQMVLQKRSGKVQYLGNKDTFYSDVELSFKHTEFAFKTLTGMMSLQESIFRSKWSSGRTVIFPL